MCYSCLDKEKDSTTNRGPEEGDIQKGTEEGKRMMHWQTVKISGSDTACLPPLPWPPKFMYTTDSDSSSDEEETDPVIPLQNGN